MLVATTEQVAGRSYEILGLAQGSTIQCKNVGRDITQGLKQLVGGELTSYTEMMDKARDIALERMIRAAESMGADAVISMRYTTSAIMQGAVQFNAKMWAVILLRD